MVKVTFVLWRVLILLIRFSMFFITFFHKRREISKCDLTFKNEFTKLAKQYSLFIKKDFKGPNKDEEHFWSIKSKSEVNLIS